jgi:hypothetical protein
MPAIERQPTSSAGPSLAVTRAVRGPIVALLVFVGCGGVTASGAIDASDAGASGSTVTDANGSVDARDASNRGAGDAGTGDSDADGAATCPESDVPARQTVQIVVTNSSPFDRYLITGGTFCDPFSVSFSHQAALPLAVGFQCICECAPPPLPGPSALRRLMPGDSTTLSWDARSLTTCTATVDCASQGWPGVPNKTQTVGALRPVQTGPYDVSVYALHAVPKGCQGNGTVIDCLPSGGGPGGTFPAIQTSCPADIAATGSFVLPTSGDIQVPVVITQ